MSVWYRFDSLDTPTGWLTPAWLAVTDDGAIAEIRDRAPDGVPVEAMTGAAIPA